MNINPVLPTIPSTSENKWSYMINSIHSRAIQETLVSWQAVAPPDSPYFQPHLLHQIHKKLTKQLAFYIIQYLCQLICMEKTISTLNMPTYRKTYNLYKHCTLTQENHTSLADLRQFTRECIGGNEVPIELCISNSRRLEGSSGNCESFLQ